jgi:starch phosphorylase
VRAGRVTVYLLDTDLQENSAWDRELSGGAFAEDSDARLRQSLLLGAGAVRALDALSIEPAAWHLANGTSAFVVAERLQRMVASGESFAEALAIVRHTTTFTTRDARPSRADAFPFSALDRQVGTVWPSLSETRDQLMELGRHDGDRGPSFNTSVFALRSASVANVPDTAAGSASAAWQSAAAPATTIAIRTIADGVHVPTWISRDLADLLTEHIGDGWRDLQDETAVWEAVRRIPDSELWAVRQRLRGYLIDFMRDRARRRWTREQGVTSRLVALGTLLDGSTLTIGFARRFTDGTRADLIFHDTERLARMVTASRRPVQFVFAGKAHPGDETGKHLLQRTFKQALEPAFGGRIAFLEDYDLHVARLLVQGCDVWLSTPPPGGHASVGGLKAAINGVPHLATPAAWWADGWTGTNGWMIDGGRAADRAAQDVADARALYTLLEEQVVPAFYGRDRGGAPTRWVALIKEAIAAAMPRSCARRAVKAFAEAAYLPAVKTTV